MAVGAGCSGSQIYFITPCRMDEFGAGALLALLIRQRGWTLDGMAALATVALPVAGILWMLLDAAATRSNATANAIGKVFGFSLLSLFFLSLLAVTLSPKAIWGLPQRVFSWGPLRAAGKYSYAAYVLHVPVMGVWSVIPFHTGFGRRYSGNLLFQSGILLGCAFTTFALAYASYHLYEKHFLKLKKYFPERVAAVAAK
jgi:peptidoglycan/LPS O-acetylase OafA/YrhL